jgi:hypothetical protein
MPLHFRSIRLVTCLPTIPRSQGPASVESLWCCPCQHSKRISTCEWTIIENWQCCNLDNICGRLSCAFSFLSWIVRLFQCWFSHYRFKVWVTCWKVRTSDWVLSQPQIYLPRQQLSYVSQLFALAASLAARAFTCFYSYSPAAQVSASQTVVWRLN